MVTDIGGRDDMRTNAIVGLVLASLLVLVVLVGIMVLTSSLVVVLAVASLK